MVDRSGLSDAQVLAALYNNSRVQGLGFLQAKPGKMTVEEAEELLTHNARYASPGYFDYLHGKIMKIDVTENPLDPWRYDRDLGQGACASAIQALR